MYNCKSVNNNHYMGIRYDTNNSNKNRCKSLCTFPGVRSPEQMAPNMQGLMCAGTVFRLFGNSHTWGKQLACNEVSLC